MKKLLLVIDVQKDFIKNLEIKQKLESCRISCWMAPKSIPGGRDYAECIPDAIDGCDVFDTVKETGDHGSFNSWGRDRFWHLSDLAQSEIYKYASLDSLGKTIIRNSRFRCDRGWDIDLDDGSSNYEIYNNY